MPAINTRWLVALFGFFALLASPSRAAVFDEFAPLYGLDLHWWRVKNSGHWDGMFVTNLVGTDVFIGAKFLENLGFNFGYQQTDKRVRSVFIPNNDPKAGDAINNTSGGVTVKTRVRVSGFFWDLIGYLPTANGFEVFASIGSMWARSTVDIEPLQPINAPYLAGISSITGHHNQILRLNLGGIWMATDVVGLRAKIGWEGTSRLKITDNKGYGFKQKPFKDALMFGFGIFTYF